MKRRTTTKQTIQPLNSSQLNSVWNKDNGKNLRIFNQNNYQQKGKIVLDKHTWVSFDYTRDQPVTKLHKINQQDLHPKDTFDLPKYPCLKSITDEIPKDSATPKQMDLFLVRDLNQAFLWRNDQFEHHESN